MTNKVENKDTAFQSMMEEVANIIDKYWDEAAKEVDESTEDGEEFEDSEMNNLTLGMIFISMVLDKVFYKINQTSLESALLFHSSILNSRIKMESELIFNNGDLSVPIKVKCLEGIKDMMHGSLAAVSEAVEKDIYTKLKSLEELH